MLDSSVTCTERINKSCFGVGAGLGNADDIPELGFGARLALQLDLRVI